MKGSVLLFALLWSFWILLSGGASYEEIVAGGMISAIISGLFGYFFISGTKTSYLKGIAFFVAYVPYYFLHEIADVIDVSYRIITGKINPAIVEIPHSHKNDWGITILSNSITMMPGTLTLDAGPKSLQVHWINAEKDRNRAITRFQRALNMIWD